MRLIPLACSCLLACSFTRAPTPMTSLRDPPPGGAEARCLVLLLPGAGDHASTFREEGFVAAIQRSGASVDIVAADATLGYYLKGRAAGRIEADVAAPARARGYEKVWVFGISMGGFGAFHYTQQYPGHVDGIAAFAPYLGDRSLGREIEAAGGLATWTPDPPAALTKKNYQRQLWSWLHSVTVAGRPGPSIYLGYGADDRLAPQNALLAAVLPADHVFHAKGGHDWPVWRGLLQQFLTRSDFARDCVAPTSTPP